MKLSSLTVAVTAVILTFPAATTAFAPTKPTFARTNVAVKGYLDDMSKYTYDPDADIEEADDSREATNLAKDKIDRYGPGDLRQFVDFDEFDGGDGRK